MAFGVSFPRLCVGTALIALVIGCEDECWEDCRDNYDFCIDSGYPPWDCEDELDACKASCDCRQ